ncbi:MAG: helicase [Caldilineaceae bacterium]|nr:helicase [Caldilineaceae bacterium]
MSANITNRHLVLKALREELVGPSPHGKELDFSSGVRFESLKDSYGPWKQKENGEEALQRDPPTKRYGIGVLYPWQIVADDTPEDAGSAAIGLHSRDEKDGQSSDTPLTSQGAADIEKSLARDINFDDGLNDLDLSASNTYRPSSMGISFLAYLPPGSKVVVEASLGRYKPVEVQIDKYDSTWWLRVPISLVKEFDVEAICATQVAKLEERLQPEENCGPIDLRVELYARPNPHDDNPRQRLITVCLVNRTDPGIGRHDELCIFQASFEVKITSSDGENLVLPYPEAPISALEGEEKSLALLYRNYQTYGVGHGCAADWGEKDGAGNVGTVKAECLPVFETASTTPEIEDDAGNPIRVAMAVLAGLVPGKDGFDELERVVELYEAWISKKHSQISKLPPDLQLTAEEHLENCGRCAKRMRDGIDYLKANSLALRAFQLANRAILVQQLIRKEPRIASYDYKTNRWRFSDVYSEPDVGNLRPDQGQWRAFQIAFLLMALRSAVEENDVHRETVELIWFPTGGGKTEAYLGLAAFAMFMRRLKDPADMGVHVVTRYTLRLLTAQQFQRTSRLVCAMEYIRQQNPDLGERSFSIGIWVGGGNTPNSRKEAVDVLAKLSSGDRFTENKFVLGQCPWCGAQMGPIRQKMGRKWDTKIAGYSRREKTVIYRCPDSECRFSSELPVYVIDEDIYEVKPSIVIGTVDKFAMLAWRPEARALFGIGNDGSRQYSPPGLIIQDELHLISGPLGSMVGLYETVVEELCTDRRQGRIVRPKIVSSTATTRRYEEQIKALYGRTNVVLFPPPGIDADDSFFARYARDKTGKPQPGRIYVGVHGPGLGSLQTVQVRTFTALMQAPVAFPNPEEQDPWWTLLIFFNSLRELGTTLSLFQSDIPDYLKAVANRLGVTYGSMRKLWRIRELTGRLKSDEVPEAIADLEVACNNPNKLRPVDACLASNILEVGVDIDRLSLMAVVGQPKSTSQYIQVTGRVGRRWWERPGLVVTIYTASKPRDRSHFEKFRSYHERLYAHVEPASVTPFSPPALDRALHAVMVLYARQFGDESVVRRPYPFPGSLIEGLKAILLPRVDVIDPSETENFVRVFEKRASEWARWKRTVWEMKSPDDDFLLRFAGDFADSGSRLLSWPVPTSMRNVDAECQAEITRLYLLEEDEEVKGI